jgi:hypothetical protein
MSSRGSKQAWMARLALAFVLFIAAGVMLRAADTGRISGAVFGSDGQPVAEAAVTISGDRPPVRRTVQTDANGIYRFEYLQPGEYSLQFAKTGIGTVTRAAVVEIGRDTQVDVVLGLTFDANVVVTATVPLVDVRSTEVSFNYTSDAINSLPLERTYHGLFQLIPGVADNRSPVGPAAGGSRQDNTYLLDGANITNPAFGHLSSDVNELDIAEVNLKRAAVSAEFGRASGTVTNAVSRSGTNELRGVARIDWLPRDLVSPYQLPGDLLAAGLKPGAFRDPLLTTDAGTAIGLGGPIIRDRLFFYGSARYSRRAKWERFNKVGQSLPDEIRSGPEFYGKTNLSLIPDDHVTVSYRHRPGRIQNALLTSDLAPGVAVTAGNGSRVATAEWASFLGLRTSLNVRYLQFSEHNEDVPVHDLGYLPPFDTSRLFEMGQYVDPLQGNLTVGGNQYSTVQNYRRDELRGTYARMFNLGPSSHVVKAGAGVELGQETFNRVANGWGLITAITLNDLPALRTRYFTPQAAQIGRGRTYSIFVQDEVTLAQRTSINAGILLNRDEFSQHVDGSRGCPGSILLRGGAAVYESNGDTCKFLQFGLADEIQPRLGVSYQLRADAGDKIYANWGRYYNMDQKSSGRSLAPNRIFQTQTIFDTAGTILSSAPLASTTGKLIDPAIQPIYTDEVLVGYSTPLSAVLAADVFYMSRVMRNFIEDVPSRLNGAAPDSGPFVAANLPCRAFAACRAADARRTYRALTVDVRRRLTRGWMADASYTWSRFEGNFDLDYSQVAIFNTSSFIQDGPGTNVEDPNRFGPLFEDRPHVVKVFTSYAASSGFAASAYFRVQSGTPWAARARDWEGAVLNFLEPAGSHRNPTWANLDLLGSYRVPLRGRVRMLVEGRIMNVFNNQTRLSTESQQFLDLRTTATAPYFAPYLQPNPLFGTGNAFAPPRRLSLAATLEL